MLLTLVPVLGGLFERRRLPEGTVKPNLLLAIEHAQSDFRSATHCGSCGCPPPAITGSGRAERTYGLDEYRSFPRFALILLTAAEVRTMKRMVESPTYRHVPTGRLAILARRLGKVFASPATCYKPVR